MKFNQPV